MPDFSMSFVDFYTEKDVLTLDGVHSDVVRVTTGSVW